MRVRRDTVEDGICCTECRCDEQWAENQSALAVPPSHLHLPHLRYAPCGGSVLLMEHIVGRGIDLFTAAFHTGP